MKLSQLHEAKYAGKHPVILWINEFMDSAKRNSVSTKMVQSEKILNTAETHITQEYGLPIAFSHDGVEWNIQHNSRWYHVFVDQSDKSVRISRFK